MPCNQEKEQRSEILGFKFRSDWLTTHAHLSSVSLSYGCSCVGPEKLEESPKGELGLVKNSSSESTTFHSWEAPGTLLAPWALTRERDPTTKTMDNLRDNHHQKEKKKQNLSMETCYKNTAQPLSSKKTMSVSWEAGARGRWHQQRRETSAQTTAWNWEDRFPTLVCPFTLFIACRASKRR